MKLNEFHCVVCNQQEYSTRPDGVRKPHKHRVKGGIKATQQILCSTCTQRALGGGQGIPWR